MNEKNQVVSSRVERLVYTEAAESSNPSLPIKKKDTKVWVAQVVEYQVEGLIVGSSSLPPDKDEVKEKRRPTERRGKEKKAKGKWD